MQKTNEQIAVGASINTMIANVALSAFKLFAGLFGNSAAMVSDGVHSMSDVLSTAIVIIGVKLAGKKYDKSHQYGHERLECVAAIILAAVLFVTGLMIGWSGIQIIMGGNYGELGIPGGIALAAAVVSILGKESMYWYKRAAAKKTGSGALLADAWHHRSDALSSLGSFAGVLGARMGLPVLDPLASVVICAFILKVAVDVFIDAINKMTDASCDDATVNAIRMAALEQEGVLGVDSIRTRLFAEKIYVDIEISADGNSTLNQSHDVAQRVHDEIEKRICNVKHCMVHVNPARR